MSDRLVIPAGYREILDPRETERAILKIKQSFQTNLTFELNLVRVTAPLFVESGTGINDDLNGVERPVSFPVRPDEDLDNTHSLYVDQWDWELAIEAHQRTRTFLESVVRKIYDVIRRTERYICHEYRDLRYYLPDEITILHAEELLQRYPGLPARERAACRRSAAGGTLNAPNRCDRTIPRTYPTSSPKSRY